MNRVKVNAEEMGGSRRPPIEDVHADLINKLAAIVGILREVKIRIFSGLTRANFRPVEFDFLGPCWLRH